MQGKVHVLIGAGALALLCVKYPTGFEFAGARVVPAVGMVTAAFGSYLPDIDQHRSHMGQKHKVASKVVSKVGGGHRGFTHTLVIPAILAALIWYIGNNLTQPLLSSALMSLLFGAEFGYTMHIFADMFNGKGCPILWPLVKGKIPLMDLPSNGVVPYIFAILLLGLFGFALFGAGLL